jgi:hypothetical protein
MKKAICTTTINPPSKALLEFSSFRGWDLIVALDINSKEFNLSGCTVLSVEDQEQMAPNLSAAIGFKSIQRRNFASLYALREGYEKIAFVDDDNIPYEYWDDFASQNLFTGNQYTTDRRIFDPLAIDPKLLSKRISHRGIPIEYYGSEYNISFKGKSSIIPDVVAMLWDGDWDVNAIDRIRESCFGKIEVLEPYFSEKISPFNSQNTVMTANAAREYFLYPHIGRFDDILASYVLTIAGFKVVYTPPTVNQVRNPHSLEADLKNELWGYHHIESIIDDLSRGIDISDISAIPDQTKIALESWRCEIEKI